MPVDDEPESMGGHRLRRVLKDLKRWQAPWYFEADLRQRLSGKRPAGSALLKHGSVFAYAASAFALVLVGTVVYLALPVPGTKGPLSEPPVAMPQGQPGAEQEQMSSEEQGRNATHIPPEESTLPAQANTGRGPSDSQIEPVREIGVVPHHFEILPADKNSTAVIPFGEGQVKLGRTFAVDSLSGDPTFQDTVDTLDSKPDSLK